MCPVLPLTLKISVTDIMMYEFLFIFYFNRIRLLREIMV
jgi:hypothetical protein